MSIDSEALGICRSPFGLVRCTKTREDGMVEASPLHWKLANQKPPVFFLKVATFDRVFAAYTVH